MTTGKRDRSTRRSFVVFEVYYKHGAYDVKYFHSVGELEEFLHDRLSRYCEHRGKDYAEMAKGLEDEGEDEEESLRKLMATALEYGVEEVTDQRGYGIVAVEEIVCWIKDIAVPVVPW